MSESTTSAGPPSIAFSLSGAAGSRKSSCAKSTPAIGSIGSRSMATTRPCRGAPTRLAATWLQPPGAAPRSITRAPVFRNARLVVDLDQLEGGARAKAFALGARDVRIVELALEPELGRQRAALAALDPDLQRARAAASCRAPSRRRRLIAAAPHAVLAHHLHQHAFAQARGRRRAGAGTGKARRIASRMAQPASTRSARSAPMQGLATRSS